MSNCIDRIAGNCRTRRDRLALWTLKNGVVSFGEFASAVARAQRGLRGAGLRPGDAVLLLMAPGLELYASLVAVVGLGASTLFVEPWMPVGHIDHVLRRASPRFLLAGLAGRLWGWRIPAVRRIPRLLSPGRLFASPAGELRAEEVSGDAPAVITFSSGTTGAPKGVVRTHQHLRQLHDVLTEGSTRDAFDAPDLAVFPNMALFHLGTGRGSILVPPDWSPRALRELAGLPGDRQPQTMSCGPAFLKLLTETFPRGAFARLKSAYVGGALSDCRILEKAFALWPETRWHHVYGSTEAEPVALGDAREGVRLSRERGLFQTLHLGRPIKVIRHDKDDHGVWVHGPNVCPEYLAAPEETRLAKRRDAQGRLWHCLGDRVLMEENGWWYAGRISQPAEDFQLEQEIYQWLQSSACFLTRDPARPDDLYLVGKAAYARRAEAMRRFPLRKVLPGTILRDRRHRARIDRLRSLKKAAPWLVGGNS